MIKLKNIPGGYKTLLLATGILGILPYLRTIGYDFLLEWDDGNFVVANPYITLTLSNLIHNFTSTLQDVYTPMTTLSLMLDNAIYQGSPAGFHVTQLLFFGGSCVFLALIMRRLNIPLPVAIALALLWAWNPNKIEPVSWIADRKGIGCTFFSFAAFYYFIRACRHSQTSYAAAVWLFVACLFKPLSLPLGGVMVLYAWQCHPGQYRHILRLTWPALVAMFAAAVPVVYMTFSDMRAHSALSPVEFANFLRYTASAVWPLSLSPLHPKTSLALVWPELLFGAIILAVLSCAVIRGGAAKGKTIALLFFLSCLGLFLPLLSSGPMTSTNYSERYGLILSAAVWCWIGVAFTKYFKKYPQPAKIAAIILASAYLITNFLYIDTYSNTTALFSRALINEYAPPAAYCCMAEVAVNRNNPELLFESGRLLRERAGKDPANFQVIYNTGTFLCVLAVAIQDEENMDLVAFLNNFPQNFYPTSLLMNKAYQTAAMRLLKDNKPDMAVALLEQQLSLQQGYPVDLYFSAGLIAYIRGDYERAIKEWETALALSPSAEHIKYNLRHTREQLRIKN